MTHKTGDNKLTQLLMIILPSMAIAASLLLLGTRVYEKGMNPFEFTGAIYDNYYTTMLCLYILILPLFFFFVPGLFRKNGTPLLSTLTTRKTVAGDITLGIASGVCSYAIIYLYLRLILKMPFEKTGSPSMVLLEIISLVLVAGFFKEIYFRGIPYFILKDRYGEWKSFLLGNIFYMLLDWMNLGLSFFMGIIWYLFFRKRGSLIIPMIGHGVFNLLGILVRAGFLGLNA